MRIIAEIGSNWTSLADCYNSIDQAKVCGADAVKFQLFTPEELYGPNAGFMSDLKPHCLPREWLAGLKQAADSAGIEFLCTAFSVEGYKFINDLVPVHKVASSEMVDFEILDYLNTTGKRVLLSTAGANPVDEIRLALLHLKDVPVTLMFCVGDYPAKVVDFRHLDQLKDYFGTGYDYGYSDHSIDVLHIPAIAAAHNCSVLEKHVSFINQETPDSPHSLNETEFKLMIESLRDRTDVRETWFACNNDMRNHYRRRLVATKIIHEGDKIKLGDNVGIYRPLKPTLHHMPALLSVHYLGRPATRVIQVGEVVQLTDVER